MRRVRVSHRRTPDARVPARRLARVIVWHGPALNYTKFEAEWLL